jgi:hypothetical protein
MKNLIVVFLLLTTILSGQELNTSLELASANIWRGVALEKSAVAIGSAVFTVPGIEVGIMGTAGINNSFGEQDFWVRGKLGKGYIHFQNYYYPSAGLPFSNFKDNINGAHSPEVGLGYSDKGFGVFASVFVYNDTTHSPYLEAKYTASFKGVTLEPFIGLTYGTTYQYGTVGDKAHFANYGVTITRPAGDISAFTVSYVVNPVADFNVILIKILLL